MEVIALKAIIVDIDGDYLIIANNRGDFKRIYNNYPGCQIGDEIMVKDTRADFFGSMLSSLAIKKVVAFAACFLFIIMSGYGVCGYINPVTYVTIDINPSAEFSLNRFDLVRDVRALSQDAKIIVGDGREYKNLKFDKALNLFLSKVVESKYLNEDANTVMLTVSNVKDSISYDKKRQLREIAENQLSEIIKKEEEQAFSTIQQIPEGVSSDEPATPESTKRDIKIIVEDTTYEKHQEAEKMAISQGKLILYERLKKIKPDVALEQIKEASIGQIIKELEDMEFKERPTSREKPDENRVDKKQTDDKSKLTNIVSNRDKKQSNEIKQQKDGQKEQSMKKTNGQKEKLKEEIKKAKDQLKQILKEKKEEPTRDNEKNFKENISKDTRQKNDKNNNRKDKDKDQSNSTNRTNKNSSKNNNRGR